VKIRKEQLVALAREDERLGAEEELPLPSIPYVSPSIYGFSNTRLNLANLNIIIVEM
jgi:hypothetical protein